MCDGLFLRCSNINITSSKHADLFLSLRFIYLLRTHSVRDVAADTFIDAYAQHLKRSGKFLAHRMQRSNRYIWQVDNESRTMADIASFMESKGDGNATEAEQTISRRVEAYFRLCRLQQIQQGSLVSRAYNVSWHARILAQATGLIETWRRTAALARIDGCLELSGHGETTDHRNT